MMRFLKTTVLVIFLFLITAEVTITLGQNVHFTSITSKDGLSSNTVHAIEKDKYGFMWFGTEDGLNKYDGINFTLYTHVPGDKNSLQVNEITALHEDKKGRLWVGTNGGSLSRYDRKKNIFINYPAEISASAISSKAITSICSDQNGKIWIGTYGGLDVLDPETNQITKFKADTKSAGALQTNTILKVFEDRKGNIWVGTSEGLHLYNKRTNGFTSYKNRPGDATSLINNEVWAITDDVYGNLWVGTAGGLHMLLPGTEMFRRYDHSASNPNSISSSEHVFSLAAEETGEIWVGTEKGLSIVHAKTGEIFRYVPDPRNDHSLTSASVRSILIDKQNIFWVGTYQGGVNKYDVNLTYFNIKTSNSFDPYGLRSPVVTSFAEDNKGNIYVATDGGGVHLFDRKSGLLHPISIPVSSTANSSTLPVLTLMSTRNNNIWIGTYHQGAFVYSPNTGSFKHLKAGDGPGDLSSDDIFSILEDKNGDIWLGTNGAGINIYHTATGKVSRISNKGYDLAINQLSNNNVRDMAEDKEGNVWVATYGGGISVIDPSTRYFYRYDKANSKLPSNVVLSLLIDTAGNLWAGTLGGGLSLLDPKTGKFSSFSEKDGLANNVVHEIIEGEKGKIWLSTNTGISYFDPVAKKIKNYSHDNGLQKSAFVLGAGLKASTGDIFFGGLEGFNYFNPSNIKINRNIPPVVLTDLKVSNKSVTPAPEGSPIKELISEADQINLNYKESFSLTFASLNYTLPQQNQFAYKLEGFDDEWIHAGTKTTAAYTNLDPGEYVFRVKAANNDGFWNKEGTSVKIIITPPFWRTVYAYLFYLFFGVSLIFYIRHKGVQKLKRKFTQEQERLKVLQQLKQEEEEAERLRELDRLKIKFLTNLSHEFRTPISLILAPAEKMIGNSKDKDSLAQLGMIRKNGRRLLNLVNQLLDFRKMEEQELKLNRTEGDLIRFVKEVADNFTDLAENKKIDFSFHSDREHFYTLFDKDKIERILFNLLSNAFKFTYEHESVSLKIFQDEATSTHTTRYMVLEVSDTGIGIPLDQQEKIFENFFQTDVAPSLLNQGTGIGLAITKEFVKLHGGGISVESGLGKGSSFIVELPFKPLPDPSQEEPLFLLDKVGLKDEMADAQPEAVPSNRMTLLPHILLVEDNQDFRFYLKDNLKAYYKISEASNGQEGWQKALSAHPQLIVSDISMPLVDGIQFCKKVKSDKRTSHIPVILLTALTGEEEQLKGLQTGANDYMTKPFNFEILHSKIKNLLALQETLKSTYSGQIKVEAPHVEVVSEDMKLVLSATKYVEENLTNPALSVVDLSKHIGMSRATLYRKILDTTGETPVEFIRSIKLERSAMLLEKSDMTISQICYEVGFSTPNYFTKAFKSKFNILPSEYKVLKKNLHDENG